MKENTSEFGKNAKMLSLKASSSSWSHIRREEIYYKVFKCNEIKFLSTEDPRLTRY